ncbi:hypothetical protein AOXY_G7549 [Acipenser oxyrinchus oxyrinchus]|uniref:Uncharacterized protein n=1 Tax=Acipenser oxyrinchus oxyrinchus TaxID=40147 RepID=A0AAD8LPD1_ACIOX|nr:hypothetical protein AOXY_G7549 [Acipenser oxyrinchus oxyrinchus]
MYFTVFCKSSSACIRHLRWSEKRKSSGGETPLKKQRSFTVAMDHCSNAIVINSDDYERNVSELSKEWAKPQPNENHIKMLLKEAHEGRRMWLSTVSSGDMKTVMDKFACFEQRKYGEDFLDVFRYMENNTKYDKGKGEKTRTVFVVKQNIPDDEVEKHAATTRGTAPHLVLFSEDRRLKEAVVVGDSVTMFCQAETILDAVAVILAVYYVFDFSYPEI